MKKSSALLIAAALILSSCGTVAQYASSDNGQRFQDGIYGNTPAFRTKVEKEESRSETQALVEKTQASEIYLFGDKKDTVMIPQDMSAMIRYDQKLGGTVVTVGENPYDWRYDLENNYGYWYGPYSIGSSWYWSRHYSPWYSWNFAPWRYRGWYDPWYYGGWYGGWYDPWYYGGYWGGYYGGYWGSYWGWYDPWYHPHHGWYDPYWHHHHHGGPAHGPDRDKNVWHGPRNLTGSDRVFASGSSVRGGIGSRSTVSRNESEAKTTTLTRGQSGTGRLTPNRITASSGSASRTPSKSVSASRSTVVRTTPSIRNNEIPQGRPVSATVSPSQGNISSSRPAGVVRNTSGAANRTTGAQPNHRRPAVQNSGNGKINGTISGGERLSGASSVSSYNRAASATRSSSYERNSSSYNRSSSSSSSSRSGMSTGGGSFSRSGAGGGGFSRSGGSVGGRR